MVIFHSYVKLPEGTGSYGGFLIGRMDSVDLTMTFIGHTQHFVSSSPQVAQGSVDSHDFL